MSITLNEKEQGTLNNGLRILARMIAREILADQETDNGEYHG